jgi:hypothetical protein
MREPDSKHKPAAVDAGRQVPEQIPEDVKAELDTEAKQTLGLRPVVMKSEPVPEDVLAEMDAEARANLIPPGDDGARPVELDEDSER